MAQNGKKERILTPAQRRAIATLLEARDVRSAGISSGIPERTLYRWLQEEAFQRELKAAQDGLMSALMRRLLNSSSLAIDALERGMRQEEPLAQQLRAAEIVLARVMKARELLDVESRLEAMERAIQVEYVNDWRTEAR